MSNQFKAIRGVIYNDPSSGLCALAVYIELTPGLFNSPRILLVLEPWIASLFDCPVRFDSLINNTNGVWAKYVAKNDMYIRVMINGSNSHSSNNIVFLSKNQGDIDEVLKKINAPCRHTSIEGFEWESPCPIQIERTQNFADILPLASSR